MIIWTHRLMAEFVFETVSSSRQGVLDRKAFIHGNMLPDLNSRYRQFRHYTHDCWSYLELLTEEMDNLICSTVCGSEKMGVICHFIADFFCKVHNQPYLEELSLLDHVVYEYQLHRLYRNSFCDKELFAASSANPQGLDIVSGRQWLDTRLSAMHRDYLESQPDMEKDIAGAISACVAYYTTMIHLENRQLPAFIPDAIA